MPQQSLRQQREDARYDQPAVEQALHEALVTRDVALDGEADRRCQHHKKLYPDQWVELLRQAA